VQLRIVETVIVDRERHLARGCDEGTHRGEGEVATTTTTTINQTNTFDFSLKASDATDQQRAPRRLERRARGAECTRGQAIRKLAADEGKQLSRRSEEGRRSTRRRFMWW
jgi:hypothetical protein